MQCHIEPAISQLMMVKPALCSAKGDLFRLADDWWDPKKASKVDALFSEWRPRRLRDLREEAFALAKCHPPLTVLQMQRYKAALRRIRSQEIRAELARREAARAAKGGRPPNIPALVLARIAYYYYYLLTNKKPARINNMLSRSKIESGPYYEFLKAIFSAFGVFQNVDHYIRMGRKSGWAPNPKSKPVVSIKPKALHIQNFYLVHSRQKSDATPNSFSNLPFAHDPVAFRRGPEPRSPQPTPS